MAKAKTPEEFFASFDAEENVTPKVEDVKDVEQELEFSDDEEEVVEETASEEDGQEEDQSTEESVEEEEEKESDDDGEEEVEDTSDEESEEDDGIVFEDEEQEGGLDVSSLSAELGFEGVTTKDELVTKYKEALELAKEDALAGLPDELKEAISFAKEGGDYLQILDATSMNYDEVSNSELVKASAEKYFKNDDGSVDTESLQEWLEGKSKAELNMMGDQIRNQMKAEQKLKINEIKEKALKQKEESRKQLKSHIDSLSTIGGVKLKNSDKEKLFNDTVAGHAMEELFYDGGRISEKKLAENLFKIRNFDKAISLAKASSKTEGKREVLQKVTNSNVKKPSKKPTPEKKVVDPMEVFFQQAKNRK